MFVGFGLDGLWVDLVQFDCLVGFDCFEVFVFFEVECFEFGWFDAVV